MYTKVEGVWSKDGHQGERKKKWQVYTYTHLMMKILWVAEKVSFPSCLFVETRGILSVHAIAVVVSVLYTALHHPTTSCSMDEMVGEQRIPRGSFYNAAALMNTFPFSILESLLPVLVALCRIFRVVYNRKDQRENICLWSFIFVLFCFTFWKQRDPCL